MLRAQPLGGLDQRRVAPSDGQALQRNAEGAAVPATRHLIPPRKMASIIVAKPKGTRTKYATTARATITRSTTRSTHFVTARAVGIPKRQMKEDNEQAKESKGQIVVHRPTFTQQNGYR